MTEIEFQCKLINLQDSLMRFAQRLTADKEDAKDLVQETSLKALRNCDKFAYESNFKAWTYTIMKNTFINGYRVSARQNNYCDHTKAGFYQLQVHDSGANNPDSIYMSREIENTIEALHDDFKLPFKMHHEGFRYEEIANTLGMSLGTVKSRIFYARKKLMQQLKG